MMEFAHKSVLLRESVDALCIRPDGVYVDGTLGGGGHAEAIASLLTTGRLIGIDRDERAITRATQRLALLMDRITVVHGNFRALGEILDGLGVEKADGMTYL